MKENLGFCAQYKKKKIVEKRNMKLKQHITDSKEEPVSGFSALGEESSGFIRT
jgi:hypothetical protein